jgi:hypothetical protein
MKRLVWLLLLWPRADAPAATPADCFAVAPLPLLVQVGTAGPRQVLLIGGIAPAMRIVDAQTGATLWSAGTSASVSQRFTAMSAAFAGGFAALDTDHDGLHDRLYAGDLAGRIWRFDLHNGSAAQSWASGGIFADFSNDAGRGFLAPPDVSLATAPGQAPWFHIAIGTAAPGRVEANNRFYVLRDFAPFEPWTDQQYRDWQPVGESDLLRIDTATETVPAAIQAGWFIELGQGDVLSAALTVAGRAVFAISETSTMPAAGCRSAFTVATVLLSVGQVQRHIDGWRRPLDGDMPLGTQFTLASDADPAATRALCSFGAAHLAECDVDLSAHRSWWRREDAE